MKSVALIQTALYSAQQASVEWSGRPDLILRGRPTGSLDRSSAMVARQAAAMFALPRGQPHFGPGPARIRTLSHRRRRPLRLSSSFIPTMSKGVSTGELLNRFSVGLSLLGHRDIPHSDYYEWCSGFGSMLLGNCRKTGLWVN